jgi:hypothetical protein
MVIAAKQLVKGPALDLTFAAAVFGGKTARTARHFPFLIIEVTVIAAQAAGSFLEAFLEARVGDAARHKASR